MKQTHQREVCARSKTGNYDAYHYTCRKETLNQGHVSKQIISKKNKKEIVVFTYFYSFD